MMKFATAVMIGLLAFTGCASPEQGKTDGGKATTTKADKPKSEAPEKPSETAAQANARRAAEGYVDMMAFSREGLVEQLKFEGFSAKAAEYGAANSGAKWNREAVEAAESYLDTMPFSREGLIEQLEFDGFTAEQARHGVAATGL